MWQLTNDIHHLTHDIWHMTGGGGLTFSQNFSSGSYGLGVMMFWRFGGKKGELINHLIKNSLNYTGSGN